MNWRHCKALLNVGADYTIRSWNNNVFFLDNTYARCARKQSTPSLQALAEKSVVTTLLGHRCIVELCSLAILLLGN